MTSRRLFRRGIFAAARTPFAGLMIDALERIDGHDAQVFSVIVYHRIDDPHRCRRLDPRLISATPEALDAQLEYLAAHTSLLSLDDLIEVRRGRTRLPPRAVLVTFDDGYSDFADHAWPLLRRHDVPAVLFVPTGYPDRPDRAFWWDRVHAAIHDTTRPRLELPDVSLRLRSASDRVAAFEWVSRQVHARDHERAMALVDEVEAALGVPPPRSAVLSWQDLRRLSHEGLVVAPHTRGHPMLHRVGAAEAREEIAASVADLERELGFVPPAFAYPGGFHSDAVVEEVKRAGFEMAFTVRRGNNQAQHVDWYRVRRIHVGVDSPLTVVRAQLLRRPSGAGRPEHVG